MEKEYRKLYYRHLLIPPVLITRRKKFMPIRWLCPFGPITEKKDRERLEEIFMRMFPHASLRQQILLVYRDETPPER